MKFKYLTEFFDQRLKSLLHSLFVTDTMLASEEVLRREWDSSEEDSAWSRL